jgi:hypothetical protein
MLENGGIILRVCYNNREWKGRCKNPTDDPKCWFCTSSPRIIVNGKKAVSTAKDTYCMGDIPGWCQEQQLRINYTWPLHRGGKRTILKEDMDVFLFYYYDLKNYVYFAQTKIFQIKGELMLFDRHNFIMSTTRPIVSKSTLEVAAGLSDLWRQGSYRVIQDIDKFSNFLENLGNLKEDL